MAHISYEQTRPLRRPDQFRTANPGHRSELAITWGAVLTFCLLSWALILKLVA